MDEISVPSGSRVFSSVVGAIKRAPTWASRSVHGITTGIHEYRTRSGGSFSVKVLTRGGGSFRVKVQRVASRWHQLVTLQLAYICR